MDVELKTLFPYIEELRKEMYKSWDAPTFERFEFLEYRDGYLYFRLDFKNVGKLYHAWHIYKISDCDLLNAELSFADKKWSMGLDNYGIDID